MKATKENKIIGIGSVVEIYDFDLDEKQVYKIVSTKTGNSKELYEEICFNCKLGEVLLEKTIGDKVLVKAEEEYQIKILSVDNSNVQIEKPVPKPFFTTNTLKIGTTIQAKTHAELLNKVLGTNYNGYMQSGKKLSCGKLLWMIELGLFVSPSGWINQIISKNLIKETHVSLKFEFGHNTYKHALLTGQYFDDSDRVVFDILKQGTRRTYVFRGVFRLNKTESTLNENIWNLIMDEYSIHK